MTDDRRQDTKPRPAVGATGSGSSAADGASGARHDPTMQIERGAQQKQELCDMLREALRPVIVVMSGRDVGKRIPVAGTVVLGRDPTADVVLGDAGISWHHARIEDRGDAWGIVDLGSTNGTTVAGRRCREAVLTPGVTMVLASTVLRFELRDPLERAYDEELQRLIDVDDLSGLWMRRKFDRELATMMAAARARGRPLGLLVMDMDRVKQINDTHGHLFGAYVIGETGRVIARVLGGRGVASRFGGDEFVAALPDLDATGAAAVGEEILAAVNAHPYQRDGIPLRPGISIGVAAFPADGDDPETLFEHGDKALYRAKLAGKNRVCR